MTVIVGIACSDGVVIGSDSTMAAGRRPNYTIEWRDSGALKIELIKPDIITAVTGAFGLAERFNEQTPLVIADLRKTYDQAKPQQPFGMLIQTPFQQLIGTKVFSGSVPYASLSPMEIATVVAQHNINEFKRTVQPGFQVANGWGLGALLAFPKGDTAYLADFDHVQFNPELKGMPDPEREGKDRIWRCVSMGMGQPLADSFLAHAYQILFGGKTPTVRRAKLAVVWAIEHAKNHNIGYVGGETQLAVLEKNKNGKWEAHHENPGEVTESLHQLQDHILKFFDRTADEVAEHAEVNAREALGAALEEAEGKHSKRKSTT